MPKKSITKPEKIFQKLVGISINATETLSANVNTNIEIPNPTRIRNGRDRESEAIPPPKIRGRIGKTHGASTVNTPAKNEEKIRNSIEKHKKKGHYSQTIVLKKIL